MRCATGLLLAAFVACGSDASSPDAGGSLGLAAPSSTVRIPREQTTEVPLTLTRGGVAGDVVVEVTGLPAGVAAAPLTIAAGTDAGTLALTADATTELTATATLTLTATAGAATGDADLSVLLTGRPGSLDETFGTAGRILVDTADDTFPSCLTRQPDGKLLIGMNRTVGPALEVWRYDVDGTPDEGFGNGGVAAVASGGTVGFAFRCLVVREDGAVLVAYRHDADVKVLALDEAGVPLIGFGDVASTQTLTLADLGASGQSIVLTRTLDGSALALVDVGMSTKILRLTTGGAVDPAFGSAGYVTIPDVEVRDGTVDADGRILVAGRSLDAAIITRLDENDEFDATWGRNGLARDDAPSGGSFFSWVQPLPDGRLAGSTRYAASTAQVFTATGLPDVGFSGDSRFEVSGAAYSFAHLVDDSLVHIVGVDGGLELYRLSLATGELDARFDDDGIARVDFDLASVVPRSAVVDDLGRLVISGYRGKSQAEGDAVLARVWM